VQKALDYARTYLDREVCHSGLEDEVGYFQRSSIVDEIRDRLEMDSDSRQSSAELRETVEDLVSEELAALTGDDEDDEDD
jgi:hypothetical protein